MSRNKYSPIEVNTAASGPLSQPQHISIAEARRKAFEASDKAQAAQIIFAEEEAHRSYDYRVEE
jgi:hypothetical protein